MKAQEYFEKYFANAELKDLAEISPLLLKDFNEEVGNLLKQRNCKTDSVALSVIKEINQKWNSLVEKVNNKLGYKAMRRNVIWNFYIVDNGGDESKRKPD